MLSVVRMIRAAGVVVFMAARAQGSVTDSIPRPKSSDLAIFAAVLKQDMKNEKRVRIVVRETRLRMPPKSELPTEMRQDLTRRNKQAAVIASLKTTKRILLVSKDRLDATFRHGFWAQFNAEFPNSSGVSAFSLPGYSRDRKHALVYFEHVSGGKAGSGAIYVMEFHDRVWRVKSRTGGWVS